MTIVTGRGDPAAGGDRPAGHRSRRHSFGFWVAAAAFLANMAFSGAPTPLYALYQEQDHFSTIVLTVVYAVYAIGVVASLFLAGHVSDWVGRKRVLVPALLINVISAAVFFFEPSLPGLLVARIVSGISVGLTTATATAYIGELHLGKFGDGAPSSGQFARIVATAANLGGIGFGPLVSGLLAQYAPQPLRLPFIVFGILLLVLALLVAACPETALRPDPAPAWRPQRVAVPARARRVFFAATAAGFASFAVYGVFMSLAPGFLSGTLHQSSHALAGVVAFAAFAGGAVAQIALGSTGMRLMLRVSPYVLIPGLVLVFGGMWLPSLAVFLAGGVIAGAGSGLVFRGGLEAAGSAAPAAARAEVLSGYFLGGYLGLSVPVVGLGVATQLAPALDVMLVFVVIVAVAVALCTRAVLVETRVRGRLPA